MTIDFEFLDSFERKRVLIVDDDGFILGVLEKLLSLGLCSFAVPGSCA